MRGCLLLSLTLSLLLSSEMDVFTVGNYSEKSCAGFSSGLMAVVSARRWNERILMWLLIFSLMFSCTFVCNEAERQWCVCVCVLAHILIGNTWEIISKLTLIWSNLRSVSGVSTSRVKLCQKDVREALQRVVFRAVCVCVCVLYRLFSANC